MTEPRDPLLDAIREAGRVPPPPGRDAAFARVMKPILVPSRRRPGRSVIALFAAALLAVPAAVFAAHETRQHTTVVTPIASEKPDPGSSIHTEADDATRKGTLSALNHERTETAPSDGARSEPAETERHAGDSSAVGGTDGSDHSGPGGSDDVVSSPSPIPAPSETQSSSSDGGSSGSDGGTSPTGDDSTSGPH